VYWFSASVVKLPLFEDVVVVWCQNDIGIGHQALVGHVLYMMYLFLAEAALRADVWWLVSPLRWYESGLEWQGCG